MQNVNISTFRHVRFSNTKSSNCFQRSHMSGALASRRWKNQTSINQCLHRRMCSILDVFEIIQYGYRLARSKNKVGPAHLQVATVIRNLSKNTHKTLGILPHLLQPHQLIDRHAYLFPEYLRADSLKNHQPLNPPLLSWNVAYFLQSTAP